MAELHSSAQPGLADDAIPAAIRAAVDELRARFACQKLTVVRWNTSYVAVPLTVDVELPGRGPVGGVDIRKREPILLLFDETRFPYVAPLVYSDRRDFPKSAFPHVNVTGPGLPAWFCLHRGSIDAWFAEHSVCDLVERARGWLRDAARDRLVPEGDGFEPTRASGTFGTFVYPPDDMVSQVAAGLAAGAGGAGRRFVVFEMLDEEANTEIGLKGYSLRLDRFVIEEAIEHYRALASAFNILAKHPENKGEFRRRLFGILLWTAEGEETDGHFGELPVTLGGLVDWASVLGFPIAQALVDYLAEDLQCFAGVPIILAVRRPRPILGSDSDLELLNFLVIAGDEHWPKEGTWNWDAEVRFSDHRTPLTPAFARRLSALQPNEAAEPAVLFGAGALGSKVAMHLAREGSVALKMIDSAKLAPHNLVRHALGGRAIGLSKAEALKDELQRLYPGERDLPLEGIAKSAIPRIHEAGFFDGYANLVDMTASNIVFNAIRDASLPETLRVHRAEIAHRGRIGLVSIEGIGRNPRIDDLQMATYDSAIDDDVVADWLREVKASRDDHVGAGGLEDIQVGLSCSSATMRLSDDVVSFHAAAAARRLRPSLAPGGRSRREGAVYMSVLADDGDARASTMTMGQVVALDAAADWQVRIGGRAAEAMSQQLRQQAPDETGGTMVGRVAASRRTIYVTRLIPAPPDSRGTPYGFTRGTDRLPEAMERVRDRTGGLLSYVGEWHTHPMGGSELSETDKHAVVGLRSILDRVGLPTLIVIVTPDEIRAHLFESTTVRHLSWDRPSGT